MKLRSMVLNYAKAIRDLKKKRLMFVDVNIISRRSTLVDTRAFDLFISEKAVGKLGLLVSKSIKRTKTVNFKKVSTLSVTQGVELQIDQWKGKDDF